MKHRQKYLLLLVLSLILLLFTAQGAWATNITVNDTYTIDEYTDFPITIGPGLNAVILNVTTDITYSAATDTNVANNQKPCIDIAATSTVTLAIESGKTLELTGGTNTTTGAGQAGIHVPVGATFILNGPGSLTVTGGDGVVGGGLDGVGVGSEGGGGSGIGGVGGGGVVGGAGDGGSITINGKVNATGGVGVSGGGSGVGGGGGCNGIGGYGGNITINGEVVTANGGGGFGGGGAGIGGGGNYGFGGNITIHGKVENVNGGDGDTGGGAGIGGGGGGGVTGGAGGNIIIAENADVTWSEISGGTGTDGSGSGAKVGTGGGFDLPGLELRYVTGVNASSNPVFAGNDYTFTAVPVGDPDDYDGDQSYQWAFSANGTFPNPATTISTLNPYNANPAQAGTYRCEMKDSLGTDGSYGTLKTYASVNVSVYTPAPVAKAKPRIVNPAGSVYGMNEDGSVTIVVEVKDVRGDTLRMQLGWGTPPLEATATKDSMSGKMLAKFTIPAGDLEKVLPGSHKITASGLSNSDNEEIKSTDIGSFYVPYPIVLSGNNSIAMLAGSGMAIVVGISGNGSGEAVPVTCLVDGKKFEGSFKTNDDHAILIPVGSLLTPGEYPIAASAAATGYTRAASAIIGTVSVQSISVPGGMLPPGLEGLYYQILENLNMVIQGGNASLGQNGMLRLCNDGSIRFIFPFMGGRTFTLIFTPGTASWVMSDLELNGKAIEEVPPKLIVKAVGKVDKNQKIVTFDFSEQDMNRLKSGLYTMSLQASGSKTEPGFGPISLLNFNVIAPEAPAPSEWTMPKTITASLGRTYRLVKPIAEGGSLPKLTVSTSNKDVATIDQSGVLTPHKKGTATITVSVGDVKQSCEVSVKGNQYVRTKPLMMKGKAVVSSSTKQLTYGVGTLKAEIFLLNRTQAGIRKLTNCHFDLYENDELIFTKAIGTITFKTVLGHKQYKVHRLTLGERDIEGISKKPFDLASGKYTAVIRGRDERGKLILPIATTSLGAAQGKAVEVVGVP